MSSPTQLTLKKLRADGYLAYVVERWNPFAKIRQDLFGFDVIYFGRDVVGLVQATTASNLSARVKKVSDLESTPKLREAGVRLLCWGWVKKKNRWTVNEKDVS